MPLLRNHNYTIVIRSVSGPGLPCPEEAYENVQFNITAEVAEWDVAEPVEGVVGSYYLNVMDQSLFETGTEGGSDYGTYLTTNHPEGWVALQEDLIFYDDAGGKVIGANWLTLTDPYTYGSPIVVRQNPDDSGEIPIDGD